MDQLTSSSLQDLQRNTSSNHFDDPNYYVPDPSTLISTSTPLNFSIGTGHQILTYIFSQAENTTQELILVTCFWADSTSKTAFSSLLLKLSQRAISQHLDRKIRIRLCFSSSSLLQKLTHTQSPDGRIYPLSSWTSLGLPPPEELRGLDLIVKSIFVKPFSVMHPKFIIMDRKVAWVPSCNVSWEEWLEGCVQVKGDIIGKLFDFWSAFWSRDTPLPPLLESNPPPDSNSSSTIRTILLPSPHHQNPHFTPFSISNPPPTPLNLFILNLFRHAKKSIYIQTPNLTSAPLITAVLTALERGINIHIVTSSKLMILEQIVTAGTITEFEIWKLSRRYRRLLKQQKDLEAGKEDVGVLRVGYYHPREVRGDEEPVKSHLKCVIMDEQVTVLGSGNMDRASWYTSQELGIAFFWREFAVRVKREIERRLDGRVEYVG